VAGIGVGAVLVTGLVPGGGWAFFHSSTQRRATDVVPAARATTMPASFDASAAATALPGQSHGQGASAARDLALIVGVRVEAAENLLIRAVGHDGGVTVLVIDGRQAPRTDHDAIGSDFPLDEFGGFDLNLSAASAAPFGVGHGLRSCPWVLRRAPLLDRRTAQGHRRRCSRTRWRPGRLGRDESFEAGRRDRQWSRNQNPVAILSACRSFGVGTGLGL
jgi:hypothetical protein